MLMIFLYSFQREKEVEIEMEGQKGLDKVSEEVFISIVNFLDGFDVCVLWMSGNGVIRRRLLSERPGVSVFSVDRAVGRNDLSGIMKWPFLASVFPNLKEFVIKGVSVSGSSLEKVKDLPKSLRKIEMRGEDWSPIFRKKRTIFWPKFSSLFPSLSSLYLSLHLSTIYLPLLWFELDHLPLLQSFTLSSFDHSSILPSNASLLLPRSLTYLSIDSQWPISRQDLINLPPKLIKLRLWNAPNLSLSDLSSLPSLSSLSFINTSQSHHIDHTTLPSNWLSLKLGRNTHFNLSNVFLPPNLTKLAITSQITIQMDSISFPSTLTHLSIGEMTEDTKNIFSKKPLPPGLIHLIIRHQSKISIPNLPNSLQHLSISSNHIINSQILQNLPEGLISLSIPSHTFSSSSNILSSLPRGLAELNIQISSDNHEKINFSGIPKNLASLTSNHLPINDESVALLPRNIVHLGLPWARELTNEMAKSLPPNLLSLDLSYNHQITYQCFKSLPKTLHYILFSQEIHRVVRGGKMDEKFENPEN